MIKKLNNLLSDDSSFVILSSLPVSSGFLQYSLESSRILEDFRGLQRIPDYLWGHIPVALRIYQRLSKDICLRFFYYKMFSKINKNKKHHLKFKAYCEIKFILLKNIKNHNKVYKKRIKMSVLLLPKIVYNDQAQG